MSGRPRVLVIAEAANPEWASVPLEGWNLASALARVADVHVVTQVRNREAIERVGWRDGREFTSIDSEAVARPVWRFGEALRRATGLGWTAATALESIPYYWFERLVWRRFGEEIRAGRFDVVHRVTPLSPTIPSTIAARCHAAGVPFVIGPLNGGVPWPRQFSGVRRREGEWLSHVRGAHRWMPAYRSTRRHAAAILAGSCGAWGELEAVHDRCVYVPENGVGPVGLHAGAATSRRPLRVAFVGRLVPYKGPDMLIEAVAALVRAGAVEVDVVGDGPMRGELERLVARSGAGGGVVFHGWLPHRDVQAVLARCHVLGFPSVREFGGAVVLEAMALGVVPVVVDYAGPGEHVTDATGFRIPLGSRAEIVERFRRVLGEIAERPERLPVLAERARERARRLYTWDAKARQVLQVYRWVLGKAPRPDFGMPLPDVPLHAAPLANMGVISS